MVDNRRSVFYAPSFKPKYHCRIRYIMELLFVPIALRSASNALKYLLYFYGYGFYSAGQMFRIDAE